MPLSKVAIVIEFSRTVLISSMITSVDQAIKAYQLVNLDVKADERKLDSAREQIKSIKA